MNAPPLVLRRWHKPAITAPPGCFPGWLLVWVPLMKGGNTKEVARRWRTLAEADPRAAVMADVACVFARLADCEAVWREATEGIMLKTAPLMDEVRVETLQKATRDVLESRFPGKVSEVVVSRVGEQKDLTKLGRWIKLAGTAESPEKFLSEIG